MTGNPLFDKILLGTNGLIAIVAAGLVYYSHTSLKPPATDVKAEQQMLFDKALQESQITPYNMKPQVVNLYAEGTRLRYLSAELNILVFEEKDKLLLKSREYLVKNAMIEVASHMTAEELGSVTGKILFESRVKKITNEALGTPIVKKIYFGKFTVQ
jgi:flagellar protein FliL